MTRPAPRRKFRIVRVDDEYDTGRTVIHRGNTLHNDIDMMAWSPPLEVTRDPAYGDHSHDVTTCLVTFELEVADQNSADGWRLIKQFECFYNEYDI